MNSSLRFVLKLVPLAGLALLAGCGPKDGLKDYAAGMQAYEVRDLKRAERCFAESLKEAPNAVNTLVMFARVELDLGEIAAAKEAIARAVALEAEASDVAMLAAEVAYQAKDYAAAVKGFESVIAREKENPAMQALAWTGIGIVEMTCDRRDFARLAFLRAIRLDRRNAAARYHLGLLYRGDAYGYLDAALEQLQIYVRLETEDARRVQDTLRTLIPALREDIARRAAECPGVERRNAEVSAAALLKAETAWKKGTFKTARVEYDKAYAADPLSYPAALGLAKAWEQTDATESGRIKALSYYQAACLLRPNAVSTFLTAGSLAMKLGRWASAAEFYSRAVAANPNDLTALDGLIRALRKVGGKEEVAAAYQQYRETIPVRK